MRARDLGIAIGRGTPGPNNAITDVAGVTVGHTTLIEGEVRCASARGRSTGRDGGRARTGSVGARYFAGSHSLNGNGEMTGLEWIREAGQLGGRSA